MPVIRINAQGSSLHLHRSQQPIDSILERTRQIEGPVIVMTHGFKYSPQNAETCPHRHILSLDPERMPWLPPSWPRALGFGEGRRNEGLGIAFGWHGRGALWQAHKRAQEAGQALADLVSRLRRLNPHRPVHILGHSMGSEVALGALPHLSPGDVGRIISMTGASYHSRAVEALSTPAGHQAEFLNITSRENDLFDFLYECVIAPPRRGDRTIGAGLEAPNALTVQLDCHDTLEHLACLGAPITAPTHRVCHWSSYMRPGVLRLYRDLLRDPDRLSLASLKRGLPDHVSQRWSRIWALPRTTRPLPFVQNLS